MIVNAKRTVCVLVELTAVDIKSILSGHEIVRETMAHGDDPVLVRVYCSNPEDFKK